MARNNDKAFTGLKREIVDLCVARSACSGELNRIRTAEDPTGILTVLRDNFSWCLNNKLFESSDLVKWFGQETLQALHIYVDVNNVTVDISDAVFAVFYGSSNPTVESYGSSNPTVESYGSSNPTVESFDSSNPTVESYGSSNPTVKSFGSSNPTVKSYGSSNPTVNNYSSGKKSFIPHHNSCIADVQAQQYLIATECSFKIIKVKETK